MSRSAKDKQTSGRRQNGEREPFLLEEISRSPVMRGRRQNSEEDRIVVENIPESPVMRGRRQNPEEKRFIIAEIPRSPISRGRRQISEDQGFLVGGVSRNGGEKETRTGTMRTTEDVVDGSGNVGWNSNLTTNANPVATTSLTGAQSNYRNEPPDTEDAPPSYESTIPSNHIGWSSHVTSKVPLPIPQTNDLNDGRVTFTYPQNCPYPLMELTPIGNRSVESTSSLGRPPSTSPSPHRLRPAYAYQQIPVARPPPRPIARRLYENDFSDKPRNEPSYRYGGLIVAIFFVAFMMLLSLTVKFIVMKRINQ